MKILEENCYVVTGLDLSKDMLNIAKTRVRGKIVQQDLREIDLDQKYDAIVCLGGGFTYVQSDSDVEKAFRGFFNHLTNVGVLLFDNFDYDRFSPSRHGKWEEETQKFDDLVITKKTFSSGWNPELGTWDVDWEWTIIDEKGTEIISDHQTLKAFKFDYLKSKLLDAGYKNIQKINENRLLIRADKKN
jgi:SAM-dependent methyltransferase